MTTLPEQRETIDNGGRPPRPSGHGRFGANEAKQKLQGAMHRQKASLTPAEAFFLRNLLIDDIEAHNQEESDCKHIEKAAKVLNDDVLFQATPNLASSNTPRDTSKVGKAKRPSIHGLWKAHASGVAPHELKKRASRHSRTSSGLSQSSVESLAKEFGSDYESIASDVEVRRDRDDLSECSSWDEDNHKDHYNAWEVLKNEYAEDYGFGYSERPGLSTEDSDIVGNSFLILGTSADDTSAQPHVLSPPLMDSLMTFLPDHLQGENFWLKFSLVRDGASLETLKRYVRASPFTIIAIETDRGEVFGSFTSHPWRTAYGFYGAAPSFVWRMRHSRRTLCASLFDQAQLESEVDVFMFTGENEFIQVCRHDLLAVGGDENLQIAREEDTLPGVNEMSNENLTAQEVADRAGFAIALEEDLLRGSTSPSATFKNPALCGEGDRSVVFDVAGLEVWSFTPCRDVDAAEKLEMTKFFIEQSTRHFSLMSEGSSKSSTSATFGSGDLQQDKFYQRVGHDSESAERRERWQYRNMMDGTTGGAAQRGFGASPRFGYS